MALNRWPVTNAELAQSPSDGSPKFSEVLERVSGTQNHVSSGFTVASTSGLDVTLTTGVALINGYYVEHDAQETVTVTDNDTTYVYLQDDGTFTTNTTGAAPSDSILIATAVASGGSISSTTDERSLTTHGKHLIESQVVQQNVATVEFVTGIDSIYDRFEIEITDMHPVDEIALRARVSSDGGSSWESATNYDWVLRSATASPSQFDDGDTAVSSMKLTAAVSSGNASESLTARIMFSRLNDNTFWPIAHTLASYFDGGSNFTLVQSASVYKSSIAVNALQLFMETGDITSGRFSLYGIKTR